MNDRLWTISLVTILGIFSLVIYLGVRGARPLHANALTTASPQPSSIGQTKMTDPIQPAGQPVVQILPTSARPLKELTFGDVRAIETNASGQKVLMFWDGSSRAVDPSLQAQLPQGIQLRLTYTREHQ